MSEDYLDAWHKAYTERTEAALDIASAYVYDDKDKLERSVAKYREADAELDRLMREES